MSNIQEDKKCLVAVPTFMRPQFLPRILACFERLAYSNKRLVIINDDHDTRYFYGGKNPHIEVVNIDKQIQLSVKRNVLASWDFDILFPLDDDDLFLPNRLINHVRKYKKHPDIDLYRNRAKYTLAGGRVKVSDGNDMFHNTSFTREGFFKAGGYTGFDQSNQDDMSLQRNFKHNCNLKIEDDFENIDFYYDFDGWRYHNTGNGDEYISEEFLKLSQRQRTQKGDITLMPDYDNYDNIHRICLMAKDMEDGLSVNVDPDNRANIITLDT